jgi:hypothetical protein
MPFSHETRICGHGSAAAEPGPLALASPADEFSAVYGQILRLGLPLVLCATGRAAVALQPDRLVAAMRNFLGLGAAVSGGVPVMDDSRVVGQGGSVSQSSPFLLEPCTPAAIQPLVDSWPSV